MGQSSSTPTSDRSPVNSLRRRWSFRSSTGGRRRLPRLTMLKSRGQMGNGGRTSDLSEAFNMIADDFHVDLLNINEATEEQLMTLPGIGRRTAQGIVDYRRAIGQFRKVEDLAIVSGVGAVKLATIRSEICVTSRRQQQRKVIGGSSAPGLVRSASCGIPSTTFDSLGMLGVNGLESSPITTKSSSSSLNTNAALIDLNVASMFQLMSVRGISQEMAANIVHFREKKGCFRTLEDLAKVKGFNGRILGAFKSHFTVSDVVSTTTESTNVIDGKAGSGVKNGCLPRRKTTHRRSSSVPAAPFHHQPLFTSITEDAGDMLTTTTPSSASETDDDNRGDASSTSAPPTPIEIYEMLAAKSVRPPIVDRFAFFRNNKPALRLATWNLDRFDDDKSTNLGVIEVICLTILESALSLVALQELASRQVLEKICDELNTPSLKKVQDWVGSRGTWKCLLTTPTPDSASFSGSRSKPKDETSHQHLGFLFDTSRGIEVIKSDAINLQMNNHCAATSGGALMPAAFSATFKMDTFVICLLCVHITDNNSLNETHDQSKDDSSVNDTMATILNDWKQKVKGASLLLVLGDFKYDFLSKELKTLREHNFTNLIPSQKDNIWINPSLRNHFTGHCKVVRNGLSHLAIPKGKWSQGGDASIHCPVWAEFYVPSAVNGPETLSKPNGSVVTKNGNLING